MFGSCCENTRDGTPPLAVNYTADNRSASSASASGSYRGAGSRCCGVKRSSPGATVSTGRNGCLRQSPLARQVNMQVFFRLFFCGGRDDDIVGFDGKPVWIEFVNKQGCSPKDVVVFFPTSISSLHTGCRKFLLSGESAFDMNLVVSLVLQEVWQDLRHTNTWAAFPFPLRLVVEGSRRRVAVHCIREGQALCPRPIVFAS